MTYLDEAELNAVIKLSSRILASRVELAAAESALEKLLAGGRTPTQAPGRLSKNGKRLGRPPGKGKKKTPATNQVARARKKNRPVEAGGVISD